MKGRPKWGRGGETAAAGHLLGIELLDHLILGEAGRHVSLRERGGL